MNRQEKAELIETLQTTLNDSTTVVVAHQVGMTVAESSDLRAKMREAGAGFKVTKNRIAKLALNDTPHTALESLFTGPTAIGTSTDPVAAAKVLVEYAKGNDKLTIVGGSMDEVVARTFALGQGGTVAAGASHVGLLLRFDMAPCEYAVCADMRWISKYAEEQEWIMLPIGFDTIIRVLDGRHVERVAPDAEHPGGGELLHQPVRWD